MDCFLTLRYRQDIQTRFTDMADSYRVVSYSCPVSGRNSDGQDIKVMEIDVMSLPDRNLLQWTADPHRFAAGCIYRGTDDTPSLAFDKGRCFGLHVMYGAAAGKDRGTVIRLRIKAEITACGNMTF